MKKKFILILSLAITGFVLFSVFFAPPEHVKNQELEKWLSSLQERLRVAKREYDYTRLPNITIISKLRGSKIVKANEQNMETIVHVIELLVESDPNKFISSKETNIEILSSEFSIHLRIPEKELLNNIKLQNMAVIIESLA